MVNMRRRHGGILAGIFLGWIFFAGVANAMEAETAGEGRNTADSDEIKTQCTQAWDRNATELSEFRADDIVGTWVLAEELMEQLQSEETKTLGQTIGEKMVESQSIDVVCSEIKKALEKATAKYETKLVVSKKGEALQAEYKILSARSLIPITSSATGERLKWVKAEDYLVMDGIPWYLRLDGLQRLQKDRVNRGDIVLVPLGITFSIQGEIRHLTALVPVYHFSEKKTMESLDGKTLIFIRKEDVDNILIEATYSEIERKLESERRE